MSDRRAFQGVLARVVAALAPERRRLARRVARAIEEATRDSGRYDARAHRAVMREVDAGLDRIYGRYNGDPEARLLRLITAENQRTWRERFRRVAWLDRRAERDRR